MFKGRGKKIKERNGLHSDQLRNFCGVPVSSVAVGTYLGPMDENTDIAVTKACIQALNSGCNFIDTAINYRAQRAERSIGEALRQSILSGKISREDVFISTKGGFVPYEGQPVENIQKLFQEQYGLITKPSDLVAGCHCMEPQFIANQIERSRRNLQVETIDLYYLHNPETQLEEIPARVFYEKLSEVFVELEKQVQQGTIAAYGLATWSAFRENPEEQTSLQLSQCVSVAKKAAQSLGLAEHHFKAIQLPLNLAMPEAALLTTQTIEGTSYTALEAAKKLGLDVAVSVPLFQGRLCHDLPEFVLERFPEEYSQAHCALSFAASFPGVSAAMVGMKNPLYVGHNLEYLKLPKLSEEQINRVIEVLVK